MPGRIPTSNETADNLYREAAQSRVNDLVFRLFRETGLQQKTTSAVRIALYEKAIIMYQLGGHPPAEQVKFLELIVNACALYDSQFH